MTLQRFIAETPAPLRAEFRSASTGAYVDPTGNAATVEVRRADGTTLIAAGTPAVRSSPGVYTYTLTAEQTTLLDNLTVRWSATFSGQPQILTQYAEIVGGLYFSATEARSLAPLTDATTYTADDIAMARTAAETLIEQEVGRAFVPRYWYGRVRTLQRPPVEDLRRYRSISDATGLAWAPRDVDYLTGGLMFGVPRRGTWMVGLEYGLDYVPPDVAEAAKLLAREGLVRVKLQTAGGLDQRATSVTYADAGLTYSLVTSGVRGAATDVAEVNAVIARYALATAV